MSSSGPLHKGLPAFTTPVQDSSVEQTPEPASPQASSGATDIGPFSSPLESQQPLGPPFRTPSNYGDLFQLLEICA